MSTHILDVSGARPLTTTTNDPAATRASTPAKQGDDAVILASGFREIRFELPPGAKFERRRYVRRTIRRENGQPVKSGDEYVYDEESYEQIVVVVAGSVTLFGRTSNLDSDEAPMHWPHTSVSTKRWTEPHMTESGELLEMFGLDQAEKVEA